MQNYSIGITTDYQTNVRSASRGHNTHVTLVKVISVKCRKPL